ncbi:hypothetical protein [Salmonella phage PhiSTP1]|nr:hypothetical protein [Salmonella phage PhiSTP1]
MTTNSTTSVVVGNVENVYGRWCNMTTKVTKESLAENIGRLGSYGGLSLNEEYQLKAYRLLIDPIPECEYEWAEKPFPGLRDTYLLCTKCREVQQ